MGLWVGGSVGRWVGGSMGRWVGGSVGLLYCVGLYDIQMMLKTCLVPEPSDLESS
jgi:hypothetical protein